MSSSSRIATMATVALSALGLLSASATSFAAIQAVDPASSASQLPASPPSASDASGAARTGSSDEAPQSSLEADASVALQSDAEPALPLSPRSLAALVAAQPDDAPLSAEAHCLATAIYYESRSESLTGQLAVARVVINRSTSGRFPTTLCGVVTQPGQFSFVRGGRLPAASMQGQQWRNAKAIARIALDDAWDSHVEGALFFHASRVSPGWSRQRMAQVGNHVFYR